jgi:hypothetical protein
MVEPEANRDFSVLLKDKFYDIVSMAKGRGYKIILLVDALDRFSKNTFSEHMQWLPDKVTLVCTSLSDFAAKPLEIHPDIRIEDMDSFSIAEAKAMIQRLYDFETKEISDSLLAKLLDKKDENGRFAYVSPLWITLATNILFGLDYDDFREIRVRNEQEGIKQIEGFLGDLLESFPCDAGELFLNILKRASKDYGSSLTCCSMAYIAVSRNGLREKDMSALPDINWDELNFAFLRRWLGRLMIETSASRQWNFGHHRLRQAILEKLDNKAKSLHQMLGAYFYGLPANDPLRISETMYHLVKADDKKNAAHFYATITKQGALDAANRTLTDLYEEDKSLIDWLSCAVTCLDDNLLRCKYVELLVNRLFGERTVFADYPDYLRLGKALVGQIYHKNMDAKQARYVGAICQTASKWCREMYGHVKADPESLLYFSRIQVDCYTDVLAHEPQNEKIKNCLAIALSDLGNYYMATGDTENAMDCFDRIMSF